MKIILLLLFAAASPIFANAQSSRADAFDFYRQGRCDDAIPVLEKALEADKKDTAVRAYLGICYLKVGRKKEAEKILKLVSPQEKLADGVDTRATADKKDKSRFARYTQEARYQNVSGTVVLVIEVRADGMVGMVFASKGLPHGLTESSIAAASRTKWSPAVKEGKAVDSIVVSEYTFSIF